MRWALRWLGLVAMLVVPAYAWGNVGTAPGSTQSLPGALVWGNGVFTSRATFEKWLNRRGQTLNGWSAVHPRATRILVDAELPPVRFRPSQFAPRKSPRPFLSRGAPAGAGVSLGPIVPIVVVLGLLLVMLAALPFPVFAPEWSPGAVVYHHRLTLLILGVTVVGAITIVKLAG